MPFVELDGSLCFSAAVRVENVPRLRGDTQQETEPGKPDESYLVMAKEGDRDLNPQQAQRNGQSAISQDNPPRELHQEGSHRAIDQSARR